MFFEVDFVSYCEIEIFEFNVLFTFSNIDIWI